MKLLLDTNHLDALLYEHERRDKLVARLEQATGYEVVTTIINLQEKFEGWISKINSKITLSQQVLFYEKMQQLVAAFSKLPLLPFDEAAAKEYERLRQAKVNVKPMDLKIASIALCHNAVVLTRDVDDFSHVPNLKVQDWLLDEPLDEPDW